MHRPKIKFQETFDSFWILQKERHKVFQKDIERSRYQQLFNKNYQAKKKANIVYKW